MALKPLIWPCLRMHPEASRDLVNCQILQAMSMWLMGSSTCLLSSEEQFLPMQGFLGKSTCQIEDFFQNFFTSSWQVTHPRAARGQLSNSGAVNAGDWREVQSQHAHLRT